VFGAGEGSLPLAAWVSTASIGTSGGVAATGGGDLSIGTSAGAAATGGGGLFGMVGSALRLAMVASLLTLEISLAVDPVAVFCDVGLAKTKGGICNGADLLFRRLGSFNLPSGEVWASSMASSSTSAVLGESLSISLSSVLPLVMASEAAQDFSCSPRLETLSAASGAADGIRNLLIAPAVTVDFFFGGFPAEEEEDDVRESRDPLRSLFVKNLGGFEGQPPGLGPPG
jgi:hypothetical protein